MPKNVYNLAIVLLFPLFLVLLGLTAYLFFR